MNKMLSPFIKFVPNRTLSNTELHREISSTYFKFLEDNDNSTSMAVIQTYAWMVSNKYQLKYSKSRYRRLTDGGIHTMTGVDIFVIGAIKRQLYSIYNFVILVEEN